MEILNIFKNFQHTKIRDPFHVLFYTITASLSIVYLGYNFVFLSAIEFRVIAEIYQIDIDVTVAEGLYQGIISFGGLFGGLLPVYLVSRFSRKELMILINVVSIVLCILSLYPNSKLLLLIRFLQGAFSSFANSIVPMIIRENSPAEMLTLTGACTNFFMTFGIFFSYLFGFILAVITGDFTGQVYRQIIFLFPLLFLFLQLWLILKVYPYETIKYLAQKNNKQELRMLLSKFYREEFIEDLALENLNFYKNDVNVVTNNAKNQSKTALIFGVFYAFMRPVAGFTVVLIYSKQLVAQIFPSFQPILGAFNMFLYLIFSTISLGFVQKFGRKYMAIMGCYGIAFSHCLIAFAFFTQQMFPFLAKILSFTGIFLYLYVFGMTYGPILWIWLAQALQPRQIGYAIMANWGGSALAALLYPIVKEKVPNQGIIFSFFAALTILCLPVINKLMIETKDKSQQLICEQYDQLDTQLWSIRRKNLVQLQLEQKIFKSREQ